MPSLTEVATSVQKDHGKAQEHTVYYDRHVKSPDTESPVDAAALELIEP